MQGVAHGYVAPPGLPIWRQLVLGFRLPTGGGGREVEVVQCRGSWRVSRTRRLPGHGAVAPSLVGGNLLGVLGGGRSRIRTTTVASLHSYLASAGRSEVHPETRTGDPAVLDSAEGRPSPKRHCGQKAGVVRLRQVARHRVASRCEGKPVKRPVCPPVPPVPHAGCRGRYHLRNRCLRRALARDPAAQVWYKKGAR